MFRARVSTRLAAVLFVIFSSPVISAADEPAEAEAAPAPVAADRPVLPSRSETMAADLKTETGLKLRLI